jgi:hypothetical protein
MYNYLRESRFRIDQNRLSTYLLYYVLFEIDVMPLQELLNKVTIKREPRTYREPKISLGFLNLIGDRAIDLSISDVTREGKLNIM